MIEVAAEHGTAMCRVHAQTYAKEFCSKHGFEVEGAVFQEAGIDHLATVRESTQ